MGITSAESAQASSQISPVAKVVELLEAEKMKVQKDLAEDEKAMAEYAAFCDAETSSRSYAIRTSTRQIADLAASIQDGESQATALQDDLVVIGKTLSQKESDLAEGRKARARDKEDFVANERELEESLSHLEEAILEIHHGAGGDLVQIKAGVRGAPRKKV